MSLETAKWVGRNRIGLVRFGIAAVFLTQAVMPAQAQYMTPPGWTVERTESGEIYTSPSGNDVINVGKFNDDPTANGAEVARTILSKLSNAGCPAGDPGAPEKLFGGKAIRMKIASGSAECSAIVGRDAGALFVVAAMNLTAGANANGLALAMAGKLFGEPVPSLAAVKAPPVKAAPPVGVPKSTGAIGQSIGSSGARGIWIALVNRTVYDPVLAVRMEMGIDYLILTPGGYFMTQLPEKAGFDDAAALAMMRNDPEYAGQFTVSGQNLTLRFASGQIKTAIGSGRGDDKMYAIDGDDYRPKRYFPDGVMLNGSYGNTRITQTSADSFVVGDHDLVFTREGRFSRGGSVSVAGGFYTIIGGESSKVGTYFVKNSAVHLNYDNGEQEIMSIWAERPNDVIWFDGDMYKLPGQE
jgi:hypothetical protein